MFQICRHVLTFRLRPEPGVWGRRCVRWVSGVAYAWHVPDHLSMENCPEPLGKILVPGPAVRQPCIRWEHGHLRNSLASCGVSIKGASDDTTTVCH